jgi:hypothetical protein
VVVALAPVPDRLNRAARRSGEEVAGKLGSLEGSRMVADSLAGERDHMVAVAAAELGWRGELVVCRKLSEVGRSGRVVGKACLGDRRRDVRSSHSEGEVEVCASDLVVPMRLGGRKGRADDCTRLGEASVCSLVSSWVLE